MGCGHVTFTRLACNFRDDKNTELDLHVLCLKTLLMVYEMSRMISDTKQVIFRRVSNTTITSSTKEKQSFSLFQESTKTEIYLQNLEYYPECDL